MNKEPIVFYTHELYTFAPSPAVFWMRLLKRGYHQFDLAVKSGMIKVSAEYTEVFNQPEALEPLGDLMKHRFSRRGV